jgi:hypothetical protein
MACLHRLLPSSALTVTKFSFAHKSFKTKSYHWKIFSTITALVGLSSISLKPNTARSLVYCEGNGSRNNKKSGDDDGDILEKFLSKVRKATDSDTFSWDKIATVSGSKVSFFTNDSSLKTDGRTEKSVLSTTYF